MKLTNGDIIDSVAALNKLVDVKLPVRTSLQVAKLISKFTEPLNEINIVKQGLVKTYGITFEPDDAGNTTIKSEVEGNALKYVTEGNELIGLEREIVLDKIQLPQQVDGKALEIEPSILVALGKFIEVV